MSRDGVRTPRATVFYGRAGSSCESAAPLARHTLSLCSTPNRAESTAAHTVYHMRLVGGHLCKAARIHYRTLRESMFTFKPRVQEVLAQVTAKHPLLQDAPLLQLLLGWARLHECSQEGNELAVLFRH